ncbi:SGNH/GDSL hydrolase family protein [Mucilaginibacter sp.]|uniref:SGNH/GDSL hydrolase family protein n=1 Tax=Mucilaginibacter sp. TaxID=1882438 RepID=UPI00263582D4|nr:SGNH/GDSL hydrolase family protein [Mucilaginibacter sp.]MDB5031105.1 family lipolytic protein [Mucilaginibacter sp.]
MKNFKNYIFILGAFIFIVACKPTITVPISKGSADFTRYIAVGNSLTAGYADGGLYLRGQLNSYPSIIAKQMVSVGGGSFNQPLFTDAQADGTGYQKLTGFSSTGSPVLTAVPAAAVRGTITLPGLGTIPLFTKYSGALENYGVPGIKLNDILNPAYGNGNPYYERLLPNASPTNTTNYLDFVTTKSFTFFTNWLGNNDALSYATSGGAGDVLTDKAAFANTYTTLITRLTANGAKGACATIPDVTTIPYFNTVTVPLVLASVQKANPAVQALYINALTSTGAYAPRAATAADLIVLTFPTSKIGVPNSSGYPYGLHPGNPIETQYVLDANEIALVKDYVNAYNNTIKSVSASKGLAVFDAFTFLTNLKANGLLINGVALNSNYISGGIFSLDGVHLTPRGYSIVANQFITAINNQYNSTIPLANVSAYNGVLFP